MPITDSAIAHDSLQGGGLRHVCEHHTDAAGRVHAVNSTVADGTDVAARMAARVAQLDSDLAEQEVAQYLQRIEDGAEVVDATYTETTRAQRALRFLQWAREQALEGNHHKLRRVPAVIDRFSDAQIAGLIGAAKVAKVRAWADRIRAMVTEMDASRAAAEEV